MTTVFVFNGPKFVKEMKTALAGLVTFGAFIAVAHGCSGCAPTKPPTEAERNYTTEIIACAATAGFPGAYDHASDMRCRAQVNCRYGLGPCNE